MRLDKWIWSVCLVKNRTLATNYCKQGKVSVNGVAGKPAKAIKIDDLIELDGTVYRQVIVKKFANKPIKKETAPIDFYEDQTPALSDNEVVTTDGVQNNRFKDFKYQRAKDGRVSKKDKRARQALKEI